MTRDFEIIFDNNIDLIDAKNILKNIKSKKIMLIFLMKLRKEIKVYLLHLTYPYEVKKMIYIY
jgi:hypothetical protein